MTEQDIQNQVMLALAPHGCVFRTNAGDFWQGERVYSKEFRQNVLVNLRKVNGLPSGFSDLMIVLKGGVAGFIEVKTPTGRVREDQINFIDQMLNMGALAGIARNPEDAINIIKGDI